MTLTDEMLPCPHCGEGRSIVIIAKDDFGYWRVACGACGSSSGSLPDSISNARERIIAGWNTRAERSRGAMDVTTLVNDLIESLDYDCTNWPNILSGDFKSTWKAVLAALPAPAPLSAGDREKLLAKIGCAVTYVEDAEAALSAIEKHYTLARKL